MNDATVLRTLLDRQLITDALYRYASTIDSRDYAGLRALLTDDAVARYGQRDWLEGGDAIAAWVEQHSAPFTWAHHLLSVYHIDLDGDTASALIYHTSHQTKRETPDTVSVIVAQYRNDLRRIDDEWRISRLQMDVGWRETRQRVPSV
jgi:ketosteroid isomerase-like protein